MKIVTSIAKMQELSRQARSAGLVVGFVPTMGYLHDGHIDLVRRARAMSDVVVVSIFVNANQFDRRDDFDSYPIDTKTDIALLAEEGVDMCFMPESSDVHPAGEATSIRVSGLTNELCGAGRPGHFDAVATIVASLFNMVLPDLAVFGEKDYQQLQMVRRMARDLHSPVQIVAAPTVREHDGLALSSRNARLSEDERALAPQLQQALAHAADLFWDEGEKSAAVLTATAKERLAAVPQFRVEYLEFVDGETLSVVEQVDENCVLATAAFLGSVRLIDNIVLSRRRPTGRADGNGVDVDRSGAANDDRLRGTLHA